MELHEICEAMEQIEKGKEPFLVGEFNNKRYKVSLLERGIEVSYTEAGRPVRLQYSDDAGTRIPEETTIRHREEMRGIVADSIRRLLNDTFRMGDVKGARGYDPLTYLGALYAELPSSEESTTILPFPH